MKTKDQLIEICLDIYREAYKKSEPPADFDELMKSGEAKKKGFFDNYYMEDKEYLAIVEKHCKKHKLNKEHRKQVHWTTMLGCGPTSAKRRRNER